MSVRFVYFDLGNVLLHFSIRRIVGQLAQVVNAEESDVQEAFFNNQNYRSYEIGEISEEEFFNRFRNALGTNVETEPMIDAVNEVFWANDPILPIIRKLAKTNFPRGILSNTNEGHWKYLENAFPRIWDCFPEHKIASFEKKALKPFPEIYEIALQDARKELPDLKADEVLFIDDLEENARGAAEFGFKTIHYVDFDQFLGEYKTFGLPIPSRYSVVEDENA